MSDPKPVTAADPAKKTSTITGPVKNNETVLVVNDVTCYWNDETYSSGDRITTDGKTYEASNGQWVEV